jgi:hypothetical protein
MLVSVATKEIAADGAVKTGPGSLVALLLTAGDGAAATIVLYDNTAASGTKLVTLKAPTGTSVQWSPSNPTVFGVGCYADITGADAVAYALYV